MRISKKKFCFKTCEQTKLQNTLVFKISKKLYLHTYICMYIHKLKITKKLCFKSFGNFFVLKNLVFQISENYILKIAKYLRWKCSKILWNSLKLWYIVNYLWQEIGKMYQNSAILLTKHTFSDRRQIDCFIWLLIINLISISYLSLKYLLFFFYFIQKALLISKIDNHQRCYMHMIKDYALFTLLRLEKIYKRNYVAEKFYL